MLVEVVEVVIKVLVDLVVLVVVGHQPIFPVANLV
jgi:hypothetical protein